MNKNNKNRLSSKVSLKARSAFAYIRMHGATHAKHSFALVLALSFLSLGVTPTTALADTPLSVSCVANPSTVYAGNAVTYYATVSGGNGVYTYVWSGDEGLTGYSQSVSHVYNTIGQRAAAVTVTSNGQVQSSNCYTNVIGTGSYPYPGYPYSNYNNYPYTNNYGNNYGGQLTASCYASPVNPNVNQAVTWYANASGGTGNYIYSWSGTNSLYSNGPTAVTTYSTLGTQTANLTVTSNGVSVSQTCSVNVGNYYNGNSNYYNGSTCSNYYLNGTYYNSCGTNSSTYYGNGYNNGYYNNGTTYTNPPLNTVTTYTAPTTYVTPTYVAPTATYTTGGTPVAGVFLSQIPATGKSFVSIKTALFVLGLFAWSLFAAYMIYRKKNVLVASTSGADAENNSTSQQARIAAFKKSNLAKKGLAE